MNFDELVTTIIEPIFFEYGFTLKEKFENFFYFINKSAEAVVSHNHLDKTNLFQIGRAGESLDTVYDVAISQIFGVDIKIEEVTKETFVFNLAKFLKNEGKPLLKGNSDKLLAIRTYVKRRSHEYTEALLQGQTLAAADKAWEKGDFKEFIKLIRQADLKNLPGSYTLKYKIAVKKNSKSN